MTEDITKDIPTILSKGTVKQKILLAVNHSAVHLVSSGTEGLITNEELQSIIKCIKTDKDIDFYTKLVKLDETIGRLLKEIQTFVLMMEIDVTNLDWCRSLKLTYGSFDNIMNIILNESKIDKNKSLDEIMEKIDNEFVTLGKVRKTDNNLLGVETSRDYRKIVKGSRENVQEAQRRIHEFIQGTLYIMKINKFEIKAYMDKLKKFEERCIKISDKFDLDVKYQDIIDLDAQEVKKLINTHFSIKV